ncbi:hypothetical protein GTA08_BOTSDO07644 [Neofusicoccum parvum]|nr:hypothetical protein GTA08_BOTSDO07644 [Neofusicoccum parvum]
MLRTVRLRTRKVSDRYSSPASSAVSNAASASASSPRSRSALDAFLQTQTQSYQPPLETWRTDGSGFQERVVAANYSFPQASAHYPSALDDLHRPGSHAAFSYPYPASLSLSKGTSSMAPSQYPPPTLHQARSTAYSASQFSYGAAPSLVDDGASLPESSIDTDFGKLQVQNVGVRLLEEGPDGVLVRPHGGGGSDEAAAAGIPVYECTFGFLGCRFFTAGDEEHWRTHNLSHFHGYAPPRQVECPLCDFGFEDARDGHRAWAARMSHLAAHMRLGQTLAASRPDFRLYQHLWSKRIIDDAEYKELRGGGTLDSADATVGIDSPGS